MRISARLMRQSLQFTDERSKLEGELVGGIDVVKCSAWEVRPSLFLTEQVSGAWLQPGLWLYSA